MTSLISYQKIIWYVFLYYFIGVAALFAFEVNIADRLALIGIVTLIVATSVKLLFVGRSIQKIKADQI